MRKVYFPKKQGYLSYTSNMVVMTLEKICVNRESNPEQQLGRLLC